LALGLLAATAPVFCLFAADRPTAAKKAKPAAATPKSAKDHSARAQALIDKGLAFLKTQQKPDGGWQGEKDPPALTALVLRAFVRADKYDADTDFVQKGYNKLLAYQVEDGGIYKDLLANYNTAIAITALVAAEKPEYQERVDKAVAYLKGLQWTEKTDPEFPDKSKKPPLVKGEADPYYGGWGYGGHSRGAGRPDLSNAQMTLEALKEAGLDEKDPAYQRALKFVTRLQNRSETNDQPWAGDDGGFVYSPADNRQGESFAGEYQGPDGRRMLRSYGSMTYAGLKSMIYAGLTKDDPRVKDAWSWITKNWTLDENPGMRMNTPDNAQHGLFYYYHTLAKALNAYDEPTIVDPQGKRHDWRVELVDKLASLQRDDGSWAGDKKWQEENPVLVTAYVVNALQEVTQDLKEHPVKK
jgi:squalene-hopene/tetraprenyl-beta-curcumene cyclase